MPALEKLRDAHAGKYNVQIMVSDGLNGNAITDPGHVDIFLPKLRLHWTRRATRSLPRPSSANRGVCGQAIAPVRFCSARCRTSRRGCAMLHLIGERTGLGTPFVLGLPVGAEGGDLGPAGKAGPRRIEGRGQHRRHRAGARCGGCRDGAGVEIHDRLSSSADVSADRRRGNRRSVGAVLRHEKTSPPQSDGPLSDPRRSHTLVDC